MHVELDAALPYNKYYTGSFWYLNKPSESPRAAFLVNPTMTNGAVFVTRVSVAATDTTVGRFPANIGFAQTGAGGGLWVLSLSRNKCDFDQASAFVLSLGQPQASGSLPFSINEAGRVPDGGGAPYPNVTTGTWYINLRLESASGVVDNLLQWAN